MSKSDQNNLFRVHVQVTHPSDKPEIASAEVGCFATRAEAEALQNWVRKMVESWRNGEEKS